MGLEEEIAAQISKDIQEAIDAEFVADILVACGWTKVRNPNQFKDNKPIEAAAWLAKNCVDEYKVLPGCWLFRNSKDATMFTLKWA